MSTIDAITRRWCSQNVRLRAGEAVIPRFRGLLSVRHEGEHTCFRGDRYIRDIVEIGGRALEYEDRFIVGCTTINAHLYDDKGPQGLLRIANERYYQFVVARALMSRYEYHV